MAERTPPLALISTDTLPEAQAAFMAGVALMDDMLREAAALGEDTGVWLEAEFRPPGMPPALHLLPLVQRLAERPELAAGFAAALGDYIALVTYAGRPVEGPLMAELTFDQVVNRPAPPQHTAINVLPFERQEVRHG